jgi:hypothetical protein
MNADYWIKAADPITEDIFWNVPEQKTGVMQVIGGNSNNFSTEIRNTEFLNGLNLKEIRLLLPDALRGKIPPVPGITFAPSTESGSFDKDMILKTVANDADLTFLSGDFSKNAKTEIAIADVVKNTTSRIVLTRDTIDLITPDANDFIEKGGLIFVATMAQLQKLFRSVMYPKMILLSSPIFPVVETLHKFTLSYPVTILTFHQDKIIVAKDGTVITTPIDHTSYTPLSLWAGTLASKVAALNLWNPNKTLEATHSAIFWDQRNRNL